MIAARRSSRARRAARALVLSSFIMALGASSCSETEPARGGLMLIISQEGALPIGRLDVAVSSPDGPLFNHTYKVSEEATLPATVAIVSNGSATAQATISITAWEVTPGEPDVALDRRDAIVTQIPADRVAELRIVLSAECSKWINGAGEPLCSPPGYTCDNGTGKCKAPDVAASDLPTYTPGNENDAGVADSGGQSASGAGNVGGTSGGGGRVGVGGRGGVGARTEEGGSSGEGGSAPMGCVADADCAALLTATIPADCARATCDPAQGQCAFLAKDADGDGHPAASCTAPGGPAIQAGDDCDDNDPQLYPGNQKDCSVAADGKSITWPGGTPVGICHVGHITCQGDGSVSTCVGAQGPQARDCASSLDNDCDGIADNTKDATCTCVPSTVDATCTGPTSWKGAPAVVAACHPGNRVCGANGIWGACTGFQGPQVRDCSSAKDLDCDGSADSAEWINGCKVPVSGNQCNGRQCVTGGACVVTGVTAVWSVDHDGDGHCTGTPQSFCDGYLLGADYKKSSGCPSDDCDDNDNRAWSTCNCSPVGGTQGCICGGSETCNQYPSSGVRSWSSCSAATVCVGDAACGSSFSGCTDYRVCSSDGCSLGACGGRQVCGDFAPNIAAVPGSYSSGPNCFSSDSYYPIKSPSSVGLQICPNGSHATGATCTMVSVPADGTCDLFQIGTPDARFASIHVHANSNCVNTATASMIVSCRKDGF